MSKLFLFFFAALVGNVSASELVASDCDFGELRPFASYECSFQITNSGKSTLRLKFEPIDPVDVIEPREIAIDSGQSVVAHAKLQLGNSSGEVTRQFKIIQEHAETTRQFLNAKGFVNSLFDQPRPEVNFDKTQSSDDKTFLVNARGLSDITVKEILESPDFADVRIEGDRRTLRLALKASAPFGKSEGTIKLALNSKEQGQYWINTSAFVSSDIAPPENPAWFGIVPWSESRVVRIPLVNKSGKDFKVGQVELEKNLLGNVAIGSCSPDKSGCKEIDLTLSESMGPGLVRGTMLVNLPELDKTLSVKVWGFLKTNPSIAKNSAADIDHAGPDAQSAPWDTSYATSSVAAAPKVSAPSAGTGPAPPLPGEGPLLRWAVTSDDGVHGYEIFRSTSVDGPFVLMTNKTIPAVGVRDSRADYQWRDNSAEHGEAYWYYVGFVYKDGRKQQLSGAQKVIAK